MQEERFRYILKELDFKGKVQVSVLAKKLHVTEATLRSDLNCLARKDLLVRVHGGAVKKSESQYKDDTQETVYQNAGNKLIIAKAAYSLLYPGVTIFIDDSSTCLYLIRMLKEDTGMNCQVITNSVYVITELAKTAHVTLLLLGGEVSKNLRSTSGYEERFEDFYADFCFLGANGVSVKQGVSVIGYAQAKTKRMMMSHSETKVLLVDSQKFGHLFSSVIAPVEQFDYIFTDGMTPSPELSAACASQEFCVICAGKNQGDGNKIY